MEKRVYFDNTKSYTQEDYQSFCEEMGANYDPKDFDSWASEMEQDDFKDFMDGLNGSEYANRKCLITGTLGLWDGLHDIEPKIDTLKNAVGACINGNDYVKVYAEDGVLKVEGNHHDGTNGFTIRLYNDNACNALDNEDENFNPEDESNFMEGEIDYIL